MQAKETLAEETLDIIAALSKLNGFCTKNGIRYTVTGTVALFLLGLPANRPPQDIDILVFNLTEEQLKKLKELETLSGYENENYDDCKSFTFTVNGIKVNAICETERSPCVRLEFAANTPDGKCLVNVQLVHSALKAKMKLGRDKDKTYMLNLINYLTDL